MRTMNFLTVSVLESMLSERGREVIDLKKQLRRKSENFDEMSSIVDKLRINSPYDLDGDNEKVKYYTSLPSFTTLMALFNHLAPEG